MSGPWEKYQQQGTPQPIQIAPADPKLPGQVVGQDLSNINAADNHAMAPLRAKILQGQIANMANNNRIAGVKLTAAENENKGLTPQRMAELQDRMTALRNMESALGNMEGQYRKSFAGKPASRMFGFSEYLPSVMRPENGQFDASGKQMGAYITSILGLNGKATDAAAEYKQKVEPYIPLSRDTDPVIASKLSNLRTMLNNQKMATFRTLGIPVHNKNIGDPLSPRHPPEKSGEWKVEEIK